MPVRACQREAADHDQQGGADPARRIPERTGHLIADRQAHDRHACLEHTEDRTDPDPRASIDARHADSNSRGEVRHPDRDGHEQQRQHPATVAGRVGGAPQPAR
jgi:hypothetical protein